MTAKLRSSLPLFSTRLTATVSVALVLLILGATAMIGIGAHSVATDLQQNLGFVAVMDDSVSSAAIMSMKQRLARAPYTASYTYASPDDVMARWQQMLGDEEDIAALMDGINPFAPEFEVHVKAAWASPDSLAAIADRLEMLPDVSEVKIHTEMVRQVSAGVRNAAIGAGVLALLLLAISCVLVNNTVRLTVYSRRFTIHTMKLVGATGAFIRRPIVRANTLAGLLAALSASAVLAGLLAWVRRLDSAIAATVSWEEAGCVFAGMIIAGCLLCYLAATFATNRYLRLSHDEMFR